MFTNSNNVTINGGTFTEHQENHHIQSSEAIKNLLKASSPGALYNSGERFDPPKCHPNTRTAILQKLMDWFIGKFGWDNLVLWLYGPAGAGKSAIAQTFAELCAVRNVLLASFFFSRSDPRRNNEKALVATLAYQLWLHIPQSRPIVDAAINNNPAVFQLNFESQFRTLFLDPLLQLSNAGHFTSASPFPSLIIIDGLDECNGAHVQNTILNTISNALQCHRSALPFRFFIASRPEYHLTTSFSVAHLQSLTFRLALNESFQPDDDIWLYLTDSFRDIRKTHIMRTCLPDSWPSEADIAKLVAKSSGQFIYAATVIRYVSSPRHNPLNRLKVIHGLLPVNNDKPYAQLDALYLNILSDVEDVEAVLQILGVAIVSSDSTDDSAEPLNVYELEEFMQLTRGAVELLLIDVLSVVDASDRNKPIKFLHASFSDFLVDPTRSCQFFINPSKRHEEAAHFCISAIESFYSVTPVQDYAYRSLLKHLRLAGPLHDNATLREKVHYVPYFEHWRTYAIESRDRHFTYYSSLDDGPVMFLEFLRTSEFSETKYLHCYHRYCFDQTLCNSLAMIPMGPCLAFWSAVSAGRILEHTSTVYLQTFAVLSSPSAPDVSAHIPAFLFSASLDCIEVSNGQPEYVRHNGDIISGTLYLRMVADFLNDPSRARTHAVDQLTYTTAAVFALEFAVRAWGVTKYISGTQYEGSNQWDFVWDAVAFMLSKAGSSPELVSLLGQHNLTFNLGRPSTNVRRRVQTLFGAVHNYVLRFKGSNPSRLKITINWTECPSDYVGNCFTADDLDNNRNIRRVIYVDESILPSDESAQDPAGRNRTAMWEYIIGAYVYIRTVIWC